MMSLILIFSFLLRLLFPWKNLLWRFLLFLALFCENTKACFPFFAGYFIVFHLMKQIFENTLNYLILHLIFPLLFLELLHLIQLTQFLKKIFDWSIYSSIFLLSLNQFYHILNFEFMIPFLELSLIFLPYLRMNLLWKMAPNIALVLQLAVNLKEKGHVATLSHLNWYLERVY